MLHSLKTAWQQCDSADEICIHKEDVTAYLGVKEVENEVRYIELTGFDVTNIDWPKYTQ